MYCICKKDCRFYSQVHFHTISWSVSGFTRVWAGEICTSWQECMYTLYPDGENFNFLQTYPGVEPGTSVFLVRRLIHYANWAYKEQVKIGILYYTWVHSFKCKLHVTLLNSVYAGKMWAGQFPGTYRQVQKFRLSHISSSSPSPSIWLYMCAWVWPEYLFSSHGSINILVASIIFSISYIFER